VSGVVYRAVFLVDGADERRGDLGVVAVLLFWLRVAMLLGAFGAAGVKLWRSGRGGPGVRAAAARS
jgi:hypothetical protein